MPQQGFGQGALRGWAQQQQGSIAGAGQKEERIDHLLQQLPDGSALSSVDSTAHSPYTGALALHSCML